MALEFTYCECGCHGEAAEVGGHWYWIFNDLQGLGDSYRLHLGHGWTAPRLGVYGTFREAEAVAQKHALDVLRKMMHQLL